MRGSDEHRPRAFIEPDLYVFLFVVATGAMVLLPALRPSLLRDFGWWGLPKFAWFVIGQFAFCLLWAIVWTVANRGKNAG